MAETFLGGDEFADDGTGDRQDDGDFHAGKNIGERTRKLNLGEYLPARGAQHADEIDQAGFDLSGFLPEGLSQDLDLFAALGVARVCVLNFVDHRFHDLCQREFDGF